MSATSPRTSRPTPRDELARRVKTLEAQLESFSDFLGGRALAWLGGIATLLGIVLLLGLAISHGWINPTVRVVLAGAGSSALMAAGMWLHARRGRTEAAVVMCGAATAGWFATLLVAAEIYRLIPALAAMGMAMLVGALATALAIRWAGRAVAAVGLIGALVSPILVGAPFDGATIAVLAIGAACAMWVTCWRRWPWLAFATVLVCAPQWAYWLTFGHATAAELVVLAAFGGLGLLGAVVVQMRATTSDRLLRSAAALAALNVLIVGTAGRVVFGSTGGALWLAGLAAVHAGVGLWRSPRVLIHDTLRRLLISIGVIAADVALASSLHGLALTAAWSGSSLAFAWLIRRADRATPTDNESWLEVGLGTHVALVLVRALLELSPGQLTSGPELVPVATTAILAVTCLGGARLSGERPPWRMALDGLGLLAVGYMTAASLQGTALVGVWALEAVALLGIAQRARDPLARLAGLGFLAGAGLHALAFEAPVSGLVTGVDDLSRAALSLAAIAAGALGAARLSERNGLTRPALFAGVGVCLLYLVSVAIISAFQPAAGSDSAIVLDLGVRQQGQVLLSALWGVVGVAGLIAGLRRNVVPLRTAALALLMATVAKVFLYDLSTLTSIYRVVSFFVLGALLLGGAFAYQRLRPPAPRDLRTTDASRR